MRRIFAIVIVVTACLALPAAAGPRRMDSSHRPPRRSDGRPSARRQARRERPGDRLL